MWNPFCFRIVKSSSKDQEVLEQVSKIDAVKKTPFPVDPPKQAASKAEFVPDFKSVLEQSLKAQDTAPQAKPANAPKATKPITPALQANAKSSTPSPNLPATSTPAQAQSISTPPSPPPSPNTPANKTNAPTQATSANLPQASNPLGAALQASASQISGQVSGNAPKSPTQNGQAKSEQDALESSLAKSLKPQTPALVDPSPQAPQKKSLNDMAKQEPQESFLSKITQNANKADSSTPATPTPTNAPTQSLVDSSGAEVAQSGIAALQASGVAAAMAQDMAIKDSSKIGAGSSVGSSAGGGSPLANAQANAPKSNAPTPANPTAKAPTLGDVVQKAQDLGLNPSKAEFTQQEDEFKNSVQARTGLRQAPASEGIKQFFDKQDEMSLRPLFSMLSAANALDAAARRSGKANRIEYAIESKTEKIAIINRGKTLPKNITESRIKNERQERVFEQIQKDIIAGRELDLEQIKAELFASKESDIAPKAPIQGLSQPTQTAQRLASASAAMAAPALVQSAQEALKESQKSSKDPKDQNARTKAATNAKDKASPTAQAGKEARVPSPEPESSVQKELARAMEIESSLAEPMQELEPMPKELQELGKPQKADKASEQKLDSKPESKLAASAALGASAMKQELSKPQVKEMITSFVNQFDQEVKKFKPPMNKISLELNPKELGNIELTITQRGNNLHISVVSNPQAINIFAQNQLDLRQNLIAQGFDGIDLSFSHDSSSQGGFGGDSHNGADQNARDNQQGFVPLAKDSSEPSMEITLPLYA